MKVKFSEEKYAFCSGRFTTNLAVSMRQLTEKWHESGKNMVMVFMKKNKTK
jgi:hypothetical protein